MVPLIDTKLTPSDSENSVDKSKQLSGVETQHVVAPDETSLSRLTKTRRFGFSISGVNLLIAEATYCELLTEFNASPLPNGPDHTIGLTNLRGNIVPVYSISKLLNLPQNPTGYALLIGQPEVGAALLVDNKPVLVDLTDKEPDFNIYSNTPAFLSECIDASFHFDNTYWLSLNHEQLFTKLTLPL